MLFSILIANYNNGQFFKACYESIISQAYNNWEVIIVDDFSTDDSVEIIDTTIAGDSRFRLFKNHENRGCGYTKNKCAGEAKGFIMGFLDPDDTLMKDALEIMVGAHLENEHAAIITSRYNVVDQKLNFLRVGPNGSNIPKGESYLTFGYGAFTHFASFKIDAYIKTQGIDRAMKRAVDQDLYYKLEEQGKHVFIDKALYNYRMHSENISLNQNSFKAKYWHLIAIKNAYKRRSKSNLLIENIPRSRIFRLEVIHFAERIQLARETGNTIQEYFFLLKYFKARIFQWLHEMRESK
jgi:glycosyltransferase involved in cell wall biosynthesis